MAIRYKVSLLIRLIISDLVSELHCTEVKLFIALSDFYIMLYLRVTWYNCSSEY